MSTAFPDATGVGISQGIRIGIVAARFNFDIVDRLVQGCVDRLIELGASTPQIETHRVPGAFELPVAAGVMAQTRRFAAVICLGCVIRGDTAHFEYVAGEAARGIQTVGIQSGLPVIFGVLTVDTHQQALDRAGGAHSHAGRAAADAAAEMIDTLARIRRYER